LREKHLPNLRAGFGGRWVCLLLLFMIALLGGCGGGGSSSGSTPPPPTVSVIVTPATPSIGVGKTIQFSAAVVGTTNQNVTWQASAGSISTSGLFTAPTTAGTVTITATSVASPSASATSQVTVTKGSGVALTVSPQSVTLNFGAQQQFTASVTGSTNTGVSWTASAGSITPAGLFTAPSTVGTVTITATSQADNSVSSTGTAVVRNSGVTVQLNSHPGFFGTNETFQFIATVTNSTNQAVTWTATGGTISSTGLFTAGTVPGTFSVTATSVADPTASITTPVTINAVTIAVAPTSVTLAETETQQFSATVTGSSQHGVTWHASAGTITSTGLFTAGTTPGTVTVTATSVGDPAAVATATVTVVAATDVTYTFGSGAANVWSPQTVTTSPAGIPYLGGFSGTSTAQLSLGNLSPHQSVTLSFDLYVIGNWAGLPTNGNFAVQFGSTNAFSQTFSNIAGDNQTYPDGLTNAPGTGSTAQNSLGYSFTPAILFNDATYHITLTDVDTSSSFVATFTGTLTGTLSTMSWGLNNVHVVANP